MRIYVASSWRNDFQPAVVAALRADGHDVYDFKDEEGFHWSEVDSNWKQWVSDVPTYLKGLDHPAALRGFDRDMTALKSADACVYVMPCGVSASLEAGWAKGAGKLTIGYVPGLREPDLMVKMMDLVTDDLEAVRARLRGNGERSGDWMITYTGRHFWPLDPRPEEVSWRDIGHALSMICRYGGHPSRFYSVAEHSLLLARYFVGLNRLGAARFALVHDSGEAYVGDTVRPIKEHWPEAREIEARVSSAIDRTLPTGLWMADDVAAVKVADFQIVANEARAFWTPAMIDAAKWKLGVDFLLDVDPLPGVTPTGYLPVDAEQAFALAFQHLFPGVEYA